MSSPKLQAVSSRLTREALVAAMKAAIPQPQPVLMPALGLTVYVRAMTLSEAENVEAPEGESKKRNLARALAATITDEDGGLLFDPKNEDDLVLLESQGITSMQALIDAANGVNATSKADQVAVGKG